jgi:hypothetical protein
LIARGWNRAATSNLYIKWEIPLLQGKFDGCIGMDRGGLEEQDGQSSCEISSVISVQPAMMAPDVKVEDVEQRAGLWVEAIVQSLPHRRGERLKPENVVQGTRSWMNYEETISIPEDADFIRFGLVLHGKGQVWLANP